MPLVQIYAPAPQAADDTAARVTYDGSSLKGATVAVINNGWGSIAELTTFLEKQLLDNYGVSEVRFFKNPDKGHPAPESFIAEVSQAATVAITGLGRCGACTGWTCDTSVRLAKAGAQAGIVITKPFEKLAHYCTGSAGAPEHPVVVLPVDFEYSDTDHLRGAAQQTVTELFGGPRA
jgi:hypothetical protein